jgi:hypothetical protein
VLVEAIDEVGALGLHRRWKQAIMSASRSPTARASGARAGRVSLRACNSSKVKSLPKAAL